MMTSMRTRLSSTLAVLCITGSIFATAPQLVDPVSKDNSPNCDCFLISGPDHTYSQNHRFWDFRNIADDTNGDDYTVAPPLVTATEDAGLEPVTSDFLNSTRRGRDWQIQIWASNATTDSPVTSVNSAQNVFISCNSSATDNSTYLTLRASRLPDFLSISELDGLQNNLLHSSIIARMCVISNGLSSAAAPSAESADVEDDAGSASDHPVDMGAVAGLFSYYSATEESDIEISTRDPANRIRYSNQPDFSYKTGNTVPGASTDMAVPNAFRLDKLA